MRPAPSAAALRSLTMVLRRDEMIAAQYFAAVAGMAAMRRCLVEPSGVRSRLDDVRTVVAGLDEFPHNLAIPVVEYDVTTGYDAWAPHYDGPNPAVETDEQTVHPIVDRFADEHGPTVALDAACGTGRHAAYLRGRGWEVIGVDANHSMLDVARAKVPGADFRPGDLAALPVDDAAADLVVCSLALTHVERLAPVVTEFARVLRPGGRVVISDVHPTAVMFGGAAVFPMASDRLELHFVRNQVHGASEYVHAGAAAGLTVRGCHEREMPESAITRNPAYAVLPDAVRQAFEGLPFLLVWELEKPASTPSPQG